MDSDQFVIGCVSGGLLTPWEKSLRNKQKMYTEREGGRGERERERERERGRQRDRDRETERDDRQTEERDRETERERDRERHRETHRERERERERQTDRQTERQRDRQRELICTCVVCLLSTYQVWVTLFNTVKTIFHPNHSIFFHV